MKKLLLGIGIFLALTACEKEITIDLNSSDSQIVIEGAVTNEPGPYFVKLSETVNFSDGNNYPPISDALVIITDNNGTIDTLTETTPGTYQTHQLVGFPGNTYDLIVLTEGTTYFATSIMPEVVPLDSLRFTLFSTPDSDDTYATVPVFLDPIRQGNNYRFVQTVNGELSETYFVFNDNVNNGLVNERPFFNPDIDVQLGDTVQIEMRCVDLNTYTYFYSLSQIEGGGPGGGTTPSNPPNNITGGFAVGLFSAYTVQSRLQVVK